MLCRSPPWYIFTLLIFGTIKELLNIRTPFDREKKNETRNTTFSQRCCQLWCICLLIVKLNCYKVTFLYFLFRFVVQMERTTATSVSWRRPDVRNRITCWFRIRDHVQVGTLCTVPSYCNAIAWKARSHHWDSSSLTLHFLQPFHPLMGW